MGFREWLSNILDPKQPVQPYQPATVPLVRDVPVQIPKPFQPAYRYVPTLIAANHEISELIQTSIMAIDVETTGLYPDDSRLRLLSVATPTRIVLFDTELLPYKPLLKLFRAKAKMIVHYSPFTMRFLRSWGIRFSSNLDIYETMLMARDIEGRGKPKGFYSLPNVAGRWAGIQLDHDWQPDWSLPLTTEHLRYAANDAGAMLKAFDALFPRWSVLPPARKTPTTNGYPAEWG